MDSSVDTLAVFGGEPAFGEKLHVGRPNIGNHDRLLGRINSLLDSKWLSNHGPYVHELEQRIAEIVGVRHCIAICNGTVALEIITKALGLKGEVILPSFTFIATAHSLQWQEITPVFCDVDPRTHNIDPDRIQDMITPRTTGIIGVHVWGRACRVESLEEIAHKHGLKLVFDAAHAFMCSHGGKMIGNFGDAEVFSFHATKFFNTAEGGAITTNDDELAAKIRLMKNFGFAGYDNVIYIGTNGKMNELAAAMGLTSLESIDEFIETNRRNYACYRQQLAGIPGIHMLVYDDKQKSNFQYIVLEVDDEVTQINRDLLVKVLHAENIIARRYFYPGCHRMEPYKSYFPHSGLVLPETEKIADRVMLLPTGTAIEPDDIEKISRIIRLAVGNGRKINDRLLDEPAKLAA